uniref:Response regulatory domain-containing protein n=1 Tax=Leersia perrieri TaxID=77586 RepID=A0A0D9X8L7_9ORYZ
MEEEMFSFFPGGLRVMLIADDTKDVRTATAMLTLLHYTVVATHSTAIAGLRALSRVNVMDVQVVLCDVHKVVSSGFDLRCVVETEFNIPVIYLLSTEQIVAGEDVGFLNRLLQRATYIVRKPLDPNVISILWRVVAWSKFSPEERMPSDVVDMHAPDGDNGENDNEDVVSIEEPQVHFKAVRSSGSRKRQLISNIYNNKCRSSNSSADDRPTNIPEHMNVKGRLGTQHVACHLNKHHAKQQKKDTDEHRLLSSDYSVFLKAILPTINAPPCNPPIPAGGAGPSSVATAAFAGGSGATASAPLQAPVHQQPPVAVQAPAMEKEQTSGGVQLDGQKRMQLMGPFSYQGPLPTAKENPINMIAAMEKGKAPVIELPFGQPVDDLLVEESAHGGAAPTMESASEENETAAMEEEAPNAEPCMVTDQAAADADPVAAEGDIMFSLESFLGLDDDVLLPLEDDAAAVNEEVGGLGIGWDQDRLDDIVIDNTNEFAFLDNNLAENE